MDTQLVTLIYANLQPATQQKWVNAAKDLKEYKTP